MTLNPWDIERRLCALEEEIVRLRNEPKVYHILEQRTPLQAIGVMIWWVLRILLMIFVPILFMYLYYQIFPK